MISSNFIIAKPSLSLSLPLSLSHRLKRNVGRDSAEVAARESKTRPAERVRKRVTFAKHDRPSFVCTDAGEKRRGARWKRPTHAFQIGEHCHSRCIPRPFLPTFRSSIHLSTISNRPRSSPRAPLLNRTLNRALRAINSLTVPGMKKRGEKMRQATDFSFSLSFQQVRSPFFFFFLSFFFCSFYAPRYRRASSIYERQFDASRTAVKIKYNVFKYCEKRRREEGGKMK